MANKPARRLATDEEMVLLEGDHEVFTRGMVRTEGNTMLYMCAIMEGLDPVTANTAAHDFILSSGLSDKYDHTPFTPFMLESFRIFVSKKKEHHNG